MANIKEILAGRTTESLRAELGSLSSAPDTERVIALRNAITEILSSDAKKEVMSRGAAIEEVGEKEVLGFNDTGFPVNITSAENIFINNVASRFKELKNTYTGDGAFNVYEGVRKGFIIALSDLVVDFLKEHPNVNESDLVNELSLELGLDPIELWDVKDPVNEKLKAYKFEKNLNEGLSGEWTAESVLNYTDNGSATETATVETGVSIPEKQYFDSMYITGVTPAQAAAFKKAREIQEQEKINRTEVKLRLDLVKKGIVDLRKSIAYRVETGLLSELDGIRKFNDHVRKVAEGNLEIIALMENEIITNDSKEWQIDLVSEEVKVGRTGLLSNLTAKVAEAIKLPFKVVNEKFTTFVENNAVAHQAMMEKVADSKVARALKIEEERERVAADLLIQNAARTAESGERQNLRQERVLGRIESLNAENLSSTQLNTLYLEYRSKILSYERVLEENPHFLNEFGINLEEIRLELEAISSAREIAERAEVLAENQHLTTLKAKLLGFEIETNPESWDLMTNNTIYRGALKRAIAIRNTPAVQQDSVHFEERMLEAAE